MISAVIFLDLFEQVRIDLVPPEEKGIHPAEDGSAGLGQTILDFIEETKHRINFPGQREKPLSWGHAGGAAGE
jgi:hypothetical protein